MVKAADKMVISPVSAPSHAREVLASTAARKGKWIIELLFIISILKRSPSHTKAECTKPRVFKGPCRICNQEGHPAAECPDKPADVCKNCKMEGMR